MVHLLDVNLLIALGWTSHAHHAQAEAWFLSHAPHGWATCPITQCGFVRTVSNPRAMGMPASPSEALDALRRMVALPHHVFWPDDIMFSDATYVPLGSLTGHQQVTDAYLVGLAIRHGGRLATLDRAIPSLLPTALRGHMVVVPV